MRANKVSSIVIAAFLLFAQNVFSLEVPAMTGRVNDYAKIINSSQERQISEYLENLENASGVQIAVLTIPSLKGDNLEDFSIRTVEKWKLGDKKEDNGALLLISYAERKIRIETGYGLEPRLTDTKCGMIIRNIIAPAFRNGDYGEGIFSAVKAMGAVSTGNSSVSGTRHAEPENDTKDDIASFIYGFMFVIAWILLFSNITSRRFFRWLPWFWLGSMMGGGRHHHYHRGGYDSFGGFGGSDSGFSGGGGHFGGGGASGGW